MNRTAFEVDIGTDTKYYITTTLFINCHFVQDLIFSFPSDLIRCLDCATRKYLRLAIEQKKNNVKLANLLIDAMGKYIPSNFAQKTRRLGDFEHYKAVEVCCFGAYCGVVIIKQ